MSRARTRRTPPAIRIHTRCTRLERSQAQNRRDAVTIKRTECISVYRHADIRHPAPLATPRRMTSGPLGGGRGDGSPPARCVLAKRAAGDRVSFWVHLGREVGSNHARGRSCASCLREECCGDHDRRVIRRQENARLRIGSQGRSTELWTQIGKRVGQRSHPARSRQPKPRLRRQPSAAGCERGQASFGLLSPSWWRR